MDNERLRGPCEKHGLAMPDRALSPGDRCRLDDIDRPGDEDGYLFLFPDDAGGFIQNHRRGDKGEVFFYDGRGRSEMTLAQREQAKDARKTAKALRESGYQMAAVECGAIWAEASPATPDHPYLVKKGCTWLATEGYLRQLWSAPKRLFGWRRLQQVLFPLLVVPGFAIDGSIQALEYISASGEKLFHPGGKQEGAQCFLRWRDGAGAMMLAEGLSTAASLTEATGHPCVVTFSAGNMPVVAKQLAAKYPRFDFMICADDDGDDRKDQRGRPIANKGMQKAREAADASNAWLMTPGKPGTDFNDLYLAGGAAAVNARLTAATRSAVASATVDTPAPSMQEVLQARSVPDGEVMLMADLKFVLDQNKVFWIPVGKFIDPGVVDKAVAREDLTYGPRSVAGKASEQLARHQAVSSAIWAPGEPLIIAGKRLQEDVAWIEDAGARQLNLYRPPRPGKGDPHKAKPWLDHLARLWPNDWPHFVTWCAARRQQPHVKVNHAIILGGSQGAGKDTALEPLRHAVGAWNFREANPREIIHPQYNPYVRAVVLRVNEARDLGEADRFKFYEQMKVLGASPPEVLMMRDLYMRSVPVLNVVGVVYTTNHKVGGVHLATDDRRHFVMWTDVTKEEFEPDYFPRLYAWFALEGGLDHCAAYLDNVDLSKWDAKAPPPKTEAFWEIVLADAPQESGDIADILQVMGRPDALTVDMLRAAAVGMSGKEEFVAWAWGENAKRNRKALIHRLEEAGYGVTKNDGQTDGRWRMASGNQLIYTVRKLQGKARYSAAQALQGRSAGANVVSIFGKQS